MRSVVLSCTSSAKFTTTHHTPSARRFPSSVSSKRNVRMGGLFDMLTGRGGEGTPKASAANIYELPNGTDVDGNPFDYSSLKGKVVLITNVASR
jgi:hypothetical protein